MSPDDPDVMRVRNDLADDFVVPEGDPFEDDTPLVCGIENPEYCDTCQ